MLRLMSMKSPSNMHASMYVVFYGMLVMMALGFYSCKQMDVFEKNISFPAHEWKTTDTAKGQFLITDTNAVYNVSIVLRHTDAYLYNNIWLQLGIQSPADTFSNFQKINLLLGNDANGWEGTGMNDIWVVRKKYTSCRFRHPGLYTFRLVQIMRDDPLLHVMSAGLRVEKNQ